MGIVLIKIKSLCFVQGRAEHKKLVRSYTTTDECKQTLLKASGCSPPCMMFQPSRRRRPAIIFFVVARNKELLGSTIQAAVMDVANSGSKAVHGSAASLIIAVSLAPLFFFSKPCQVRTSSLPPITFVNNLQLWHNLSDYLILLIRFLIGKSLAKVNLLPQRLALTLYRSVRRSTMITKGICNHDILLSLVLRNHSLNPLLKDLEYCLVYSLDTTRGNVT